jgi:hypothetical protein
MADLQKSVLDDKHNVTQPNAGRQARLEAGAERSEA